MMKNTCGKIIRLKSDFCKGEIYLDTAEMVCIPSKPHYQEVELAFKRGANLVIATVNENCIPFEDRIILGNEIEKRWNAYPELKKRIDQLETIITKWRMK